MIAVRMEPELFYWAQEMGGGAWVRHVLEKLRVLADREGFKPYWELLKDPEAEIPPES